MIALIALSPGCASSPTPTPTPAATLTPRATRTLIPDAPTPAPTQTDTPTPTPTPTPFPTVNYSFVLKPGPAFDSSPGTAEFISKGNQTEVNIAINSRFVGQVRAAQIQEGFCLASGILKFPLTNVVDGKSTTIISDTLGSLLTGALSLNLKPAPDAATFIACNGLPKGSVVYFGPGKDEHRAGAALLLAAEGRTEVTLQMAMETPDIVRPVRIYAGSCPNVGEVKYPLNNIVDGKSFTSVPIPLADFLRTSSAISVLKSSAESNVFVACGAIK
ncbi:MAG: hypothetical protein HY327_11465 [Chloroflexi bacterium]|nr:hypothetical protein [Chloroflexota bacterium]